jgi:hypothetical protein
MKIDIITLHAVSNYGSVLQSLATQEMFKKHGLEVEFINYQREDCRSIFGFLKNQYQNRKSILFPIKVIVYLPTLLRWNYVFRGFLEKHIKTTKKVYTHDIDFKRNVPEADIYCTGSDQVWNSKLNDGILKMFFLNFVPKGKKKIAYSASFGKDKLDEWEKSETKELLSSYSYITVRENSGVSIIKELGLNNVEQILDPTLLFDKDFWTKFMSKRIIKAKYLFVYQLHAESDIDKYIQEVAKQKNLKIIRLCYRYDQFFQKGHCLLIPTIEDFLSAIYNSDLVITDSFHVTAFSVNLNKQFISIIPKHQFGGRISSFLELIGLSHRAIHQFSDFSPLQQVADFSKANKMLASERIRINALVDKITHV